MKTFLITRGKEENKNLEKHLETLGVNPVPCPLFSIEYLPYTFKLFQDIQGLIITSKNGIRSIAQRKELKKIPLFTVGQITKKFAMKLGFINVIGANGSVDDLAKLIISTTKPQNGKFIHLSGQQIRGNLDMALRSSGFLYERIITYKTIPLNSLPQETYHSIKNYKIDGVLFFSPNTADIFVKLAKKYEILEQCEKMESLCLSQNVMVKASKIRWKKFWIAPHPTMNCLLEYFYEKN